jgi:hypothetical protein
MKNSDAIMDLLGAYIHVIGRKYEGDERQRSLFYPLSLPNLHSYPPSVARKLLK